MTDDIAHFQSGNIDFQPAARRSLLWALKKIGADFAAQLTHAAEAFVQNERNVFALYAKWRSWSRICVKNQYRPHVADVSNRMAFGFWVRFQQFNRTDFARFVGRCRRAGFSARPARAAEYRDDLLSRRARGERSVCIGFAVNFENGNGDFFGNFGAQRVNHSASGPRLQNFLRAFVAFSAFSWTSWKESNIRSVCFKPLAATARVWRRPRVRLRCGYCKPPSIKNLRVRSQIRGDQRMDALPSGNGQPGMRLWLWRHRPHTGGTR